MNTLKLLAFPFGVCLVIATLLGAAQLTGSKLDLPAGAGGNPKVPVAPAAKSNDGLVQKGTVSPEHDPLQFYVPAHLPAARVAEVKVFSGQSVKPGDLLVRFDGWQQLQDLTKAEAAVESLRWELQAAQTAKQQHLKTLELAKLAVEDATKRAAKAKEVTDVVREKLEKIVPIAGGKDLRSQEKYPELLQLQGVQEAAQSAVKEKQLQLELAQLVNPDVKIQVLGHQIRAAEAEREKAKQALDRCNVLADFGGTIEKVTAHPGQVVYPQMRQPLFYLIPDGSRVVKVEVVPEFAYKIQGKEGTKVSISDDSNANLTYDGTLERICSAFLPKTNGLDFVTGKPSNVLEVIVRVTDAYPVNKPPLRVGQPVRVTFP